MTNKIQSATAMLMVILAGAMWSPCYIRAENGNAVNWVTYAEAKKKLNSDRKFFVYFYSNNCGYCEKLEEESFADDRVADILNTHYIPVRVNIDNETQLAKQYHVMGVPDLRFLKTNGEDLARSPGYSSKTRIINLLRFIHTDSYETMNFRDFVKSQGSR